MYLILDQMCYRNAGVNLKNCGVSQEKYNIYKHAHFLMKNIQSICNMTYVRSLQYKSNFIFCRNVHVVTAIVTFTIIVLLLLIVFGVAYKLQMIKFFCRKNSGEQSGIGGKAITEK